MASIMTADSSRLASQTAHSYDSGMKKRPTVLAWVWFVLGVPLMAFGAITSQADTFSAGVLCLIAGRIWY